MTVKTAISLPDDVFAAAEELAAELGVSRSELYARAIDGYVKGARRADVAVVDHGRAVLERTQW